MATSKGRKVQFTKDITLSYKCGCKVDVKKINVMMIDKELEFASKVRCGECCK